MTPCADAARGLKAGAAIGTQAAFAASFEPGSVSLPRYADVTREAEGVSARCIASVGLGNAGIGRWPEAMGSSCGKTACDETLAHAVHRVLPCITLTRRKQAATNLRRALAAACRFAAARVPRGG
jgi:hypothetical protein